MSGLAIIAGSPPNFSAMIGSREPTVLAITTIPTMVMPTIIETCTPTLSKKKHFKNATMPRASPHIRPTKISLRTTLAQSLGSISWVAIARIISVDDWLPAFHPESVSIGINIFKAITAWRTYS